MSAFFNVSQTIFAKRTVHFTSRAQHIKTLKFKIKFITFWNAFIHSLSQPRVESDHGNCLFFPSPHRIIIQQREAQLDFNLLFHTQKFAYLPLPVERNHRGVQKLLNAILNWTFNKCPIMCWVERFANVLAWLKLNLLSIPLSFRA